MKRFRFAIWLLVALIATTLPSVSHAQILTITLIPPELPVYEQPAIPAPGYLWTPGFWAYGPDGYYWVPGTWVEPPSVGLLWTPGYWGWRDGAYLWNAGYWGPHIGFYGGVNYGFGYGGVGYEGGRWNNGVFAYNRTVNNFGGVTITNVYNKTVIVNANAPRTSFNGGTGGLTAQPTREEQAVAHEQHVPPTTGQVQHEKTASTDRSLLASVNHGSPAIAATSKPGEFTGKGVVHAQEVKPSPAATSPAATSPAAASPAATSPAATSPAAATPAAKEKKPPVGNVGRTPNNATTPKSAAKPMTEPTANQVKPRAATPPPPKAAAVKPAPAPPKAPAAKPAPPPRPAAVRRPPPKPPAPPKPHGPPPKREPPK